MVDPFPSPDIGDDTSVRPGPGATTGTPRWVKVFGIIALVVVLLFVILLFTRGPVGDHGPDRHTSSGDNGGQMLPSAGHGNSGGVGGPADADEATSPDTMTFEPGRINVSAGETMTFLATTTGQAVHALTLRVGAMPQEHADEIDWMGDEMMVPDGPTRIMLQPWERSSRPGGPVTPVRPSAAVESGHHRVGTRGQITTT